MKRLFLNLMSLAVLGVVAFGFTACNTSSCGGTDGNCDQSWDFYEQCNLIEGRQERCCANDCDCCPEPNCGTGINMEVSSPCATVPMGGMQGMPAGAVVLEEEIIEEAPAVLEGN